MWLIFALLVAQDALTKFEGYPATDLLKGPPAKPILRGWHRNYRTRIREAAAEGPDFAGHFKIAEWGCGSGCAGIAIIDEKTGAVYDGPFAFVSMLPGFRYSELPELDPSAMLQRKLNSRLLIVHGCPEEKNCASYYYEWTGSRFKLLKRIPAVESH
jgi:hypothetical protein